MKDTIKYSYDYHLRTCTIKFNTTSKEAFRQFLLTLLVYRIRHRMHTLQVEECLLRGSII